MATHVQSAWTGACSCITPMCVFRQMRTERVGVCRCAHVYICMFGSEKRSELSFNAAQTPLILVFCLSLTGTQSKPRNHRPGSLTLLNICPDMQIQTHRYTCTISRWQTFAKHYAASVHCISVQVLPFKVSVLKADELASVSQPDLGNCNLWAWALEEFHTDMASLCVSSLSSLPKYLKRKCVWGHSFFTVCPIFPAQVFWARCES